MERTMKGVPEMDRSILTAEAYPRLTPGNRIPENPPDRGPDFARASSRVAIRENPKDFSQATSSQKLITHADPTPATMFCGWGQRGFERREV